MSNDNNKYNNDFNFEENGEMYRIVEEETKKLSFFERLVSIFVSPVQLMRNIKQKPVYGAPLLIILAISLLSAFFVQQYSEITMQEQSMISLERYGVDYFSTESLGEAEGIVAASTAIGAVVGGVLGYIIYALFSVLVLMIFTKIAKGKASFKQYYSMYLHAYVISSLGALILYITSVMMGSTLNILSLAALFMPGGNMTQPIYLLLMSINIFAIWETVLVCIGVREINGFSTTKAVVIVGIMFALGCVINMLMSYGVLIMYDWVNSAMLGI